MRRSGRFIMKGRQSVARPVRSITELMNISFLRDVLRYLVKMWLGRMLPMRNPEKPRVHTRLIVDVSVAKLYARYGCIGPVSDVTLWNFYCTWRHHARIAY